MSTGSISSEELGPTIRLIPSEWNAAVSAQRGRILLDRRRLKLGPSQRTSRRSLTGRSWSSRCSSSSVHQVAIQETICVSRKHEWTFFKVESRFQLRQGHGLQDAASCMTLSPAGCLFVCFLLRRHLCHVSSDSIAVAAVSPRPPASFMPQIWGTAAGVMPRFHGSLQET